ncbi:hypothetical protein AURANDRAFT_66941 [Aureococcus anophagefferens]|uniref:GHMP kinase C-terminal domain-containing protein n=1 Tax=Aureococcus anophagefferens TaxID=44056 RepID=F0YJD0_AURAN|nr:hypothetical protein AURANDRAFT_66941 [Aureococcus anophagefferens]EGB04768.1 hypothetical protein AURANDRAFT_66941 [Aureococcus anophagefferens]|eukprot:XP_009040505.1 hypothetical protein AURANDRAFT_66941 [Aureococcus anophagefferens]
MGPGFDALGMGIDIWNEISVERAGSFSIETEGEGVGAIPEEVGPNGESKHTVMVALKRAFEYGGARGLRPEPVAAAGGAAAAGHGDGGPPGQRGSPAPTRLRSLVRSLRTYDLRAHAGVAGDLRRHPALGAALRDRDGGAAREPAAGAVAARADARGHAPRGVRAEREDALLVREQGQDDGDARAAAGDDPARRRGLQHPAHGAAQRRVKNGWDFGAGGRGERQRAIATPRAVSLSRDPPRRLALSRPTAPSRSLATHRAVSLSRDPPRRQVTAGAHGAFLSGAGPTVLAICSGATGADIFTQAREERQEMKVAEAMRSAVNALPAKADQWKDGKFYICSPCMQGAHVVAADPPLSDTMATFGTLDGMLPGRITPSGFRRALRERGDASEGLPLLADLVALSLDELVRVLDVRVEGGGELREVALDLVELRVALGDALLELDGPPRQLDLLLRHVVRERRARLREQRLGLPQLGVRRLQRRVVLLLERELGVMRLAQLRRERVLRGLELDLERVLARRGRLERRGVRLVRLELAVVLAHERVGEGEAQLLDLRLVAERGVEAGWAWSCLVRADERVGAAE